MHFTLTKFFSNDALGYMYRYGDRLVMLHSSGYIFFISSVRSVKYNNKCCFFKLNITVGVLTRCVAWWVRARGQFQLLGKIYFCTRLTRPTKAGIYLLYQPDFTQAKEGNPQKCKKCTSWSLFASVLKSSARHSTWLHPLHQNILYINEIDAAK